MRCNFFDVKRQEYGTSMLGNNDLRSVPQRIRFIASDCFDLKAVARAYVCWPIRSNKNRPAAANSPTRSSRIIERESKSCLPFIGLIRLNALRVASRANVICANVWASLRAAIARRTSCLFRSCRRLRRFLSNERLMGALESEAAHARPDDDRIPEQKRHYCLLVAASSNI